MFLYIRKYEIWFFVEIFLQKLIHMDKPQTPPPPYVDLCGYFTNPLPPPSRSTFHQVGFELAREIKTRPGCIYLYNEVRKK